MMTAVTAIGLITPGQGGVVTDGRRDGVQYITNLLFAFVPVDQGLVRGVFDVTTETTGIA